MRDIDQPAGEQRWRLQEKLYIQSPIHQVLSLSLVVSGPGDIQIRYTPAVSTANAQGHVSGAALAGMADSAVLQAVRTGLGPDQGLVTLELKINYLRPARADEPLVATSKLVHDGRTTAVGIAEIRDDAGNAVAVATATAAKVRR